MGSCLDESLGLGVVAADAALLMVCGLGMVGAKKLNAREASNFAATLPPQNGLARNQSWRLPRQVTKNAKLPDKKESPLS